MDWETILAKFLKFIFGKKKPSVKKDQHGNINIMIDSLNLTITEPAAKILENLLQQNIPEPKQIAIKEEILKRLKPLEPTIKLLSGSAAAEVVTSATLSTTAEIVDLVITKKSQDEED